MREFVSAGGELMIHAALHPKNSPTPELVSVHYIFCINQSTTQPINHSTRQLFNDS